MTSHSAKKKASHTALEYLGREEEFVAPPDLGICCSILLSYGD